MLLLCTDQTTCCCCALIRQHAIVVQAPADTFMPLGHACQHQQSKRSGTCLTPLRQAQQSQLTEPSSRSPDIRPAFEYSSKKELKQVFTQSTAFRVLGANWGQQTIDQETVRSETELELQYKCQNLKFAKQVSTGVALLSLSVLGRYWTIQGHP